MERQEEKTGSITKKFDILIGVLGGLVYAIFAWGVDGYLLQQHNGSIPWLKLAFGIPVVFLIFFIRILH